MNLPNKPLTVGWKVSSLSPAMASVRYRAMLPLLALEGQGIRGRVFASGLESHLDDIDVLVIVKSLKPEDLFLAQAAEARGIQVVFDLCDNIFIEDYAVKSGPSAADMFLGIAAHANCIVTTTEPLAAEIRKRLPELPVVVIPDGIETWALTKRIIKRLKDAQVAEQRESSRLQRVRRRVGNALERVRSEGLRSIAPLVRSAAGQLRKVAAQQLRRRFKGKARPPAVQPQALPLPGDPGETGAGVQPLKILWFGNHGAPYANFGMLDILEYKDALEAVAREFPVQLVVVSNNQQKFEQYIQPLAIPTKYQEWSPKAVEQWLERAAVVIVPNTLDAFSVCKSANRTVLAFASGVPVVATPTPALDPLAAFMHLGDPLQGLRAYLSDRAKGREDGQQGYRLAEALFGQPALAAAWATLLRQMPQRKDETGQPQPWLGVVLHLIQDLDLAIPILRAAQAGGVPAQAWCSTTVFKKSPRVLAALKANDVAFKVLPEDKRLAELRFPRSMRALLTVAETNLNPHRFPRQLSEAAARAGLLVATLQHGYENVGLSYDDPVHPIEKIDIAAHRIYTWGPLRTLHPRTPAAVRARCRPIGCPKDAVVHSPDFTGLLPEDRVIVGVFENMHWHRYSDAYREAFMANVQAMAAAFPGICFVIKPHHAGLWMTKRYQGDKPAADNLLIADPQRPEWENHTAGALLGRMSAVITTPSTVALDAARHGLPVAVVAADLQLDNYLPLPLLAAKVDWVRFLSDAMDPDGRSDLRQQSENFIARTVVPGDAAMRIVEDLRETVGS